MTLTQSTAIVAENVPASESEAQLYRVDEDQADDPEAAWRGLLNTAEIGRRYPMFAALITGDWSESLTYTHELWRVRIEPVYEP